MVWDIKEQRFHHTMIHCSLKSYAREEPFRVQLKKCTDPSTNSVLEELKQTSHLLKMWLVIQNSTQELSIHLSLTPTQNSLSLMKAQKPDSKEPFNSWEKWRLMETQNSTQRKSPLYTLEESNQKFQSPQSSMSLSHHPLDGEPSCLKEDQKDSPKLFESTINHLSWTPPGEMLISPC